ncbi:MAG: hypothetical protein N3C12_04100 [Candidatus Binatia bacterium]|nr:hypothetical protein [Candidatus Binatia bacterium]
MSRETDIRGDRRLLQVLGTFVLMLGAGLVLDRALPVVGWLLTLAGAALLVAAVWGSRSGEDSPPSTREFRGNGAEESSAGLAQ